MVVLLYYFLRVMCVHKMCDENMSYLYLGDMLGPFIIPE